MRFTLNKTKIITVVGPTASGKTSLGVEICKKFNGEVISADSMQIYKGMNIATAKPAVGEMQGIKHHLIDFVEPDNEYSVASFCSDASKCVDEIVNKGKIPVIVGGTGLYVDSFINNISFLDNAFSESVRENLFKRLSEEGAQSLYNELKAVDPEASEKIHPNNSVKVIRALEVYYCSGFTISQQVEQSKNNPSDFDCLFIGLNFKNREILYNRINKRVDLMIENGLLDEARSFYDGKTSSTSVNAIGYKELKPFLDGNLSIDECIENLKKSTRHYAKRQLTWFKRNNLINWFYPDEYLSNNDLKNDVFKLIKLFSGR